MNAPATPGWTPITELIPRRRSIDGPADLEEVYALPERPHLRIDFVVSIDGGIEIDGRSGGLGGPVDRAAFMAMRAVADAILVGAGTARAENYGPTAMAPEVEERRLARGLSRRPPLIVVTASGILDQVPRLFSGDNRVIVVTTEPEAQSAAGWPKEAEVLACGRTEVDLVGALRLLRGQGLLRILCEGGPMLTKTLMMDGLVDELCLTISPLITGSGTARLSGRGDPGYDGRLELSGLLEGDSMLLARYRLPAGPGLE